MQPSGAQPLQEICNDFMQSLYFNQGIAPVIVRTAQRLSEDQKVGALLPSQYFILSSSNYVERSLRLVFLLRV